MRAWLARVFMQFVDAVVEALLIVVRSKIIAAC